MMCSVVLEGKDNVDTIYTDLTRLLDSAVKAGRFVYVHVTPPVWDITAKSEGEICISDAENRGFKMLVTMETAPFIFAALKNSIFAAGRRVIGWDLKPMFSWFKRHLKQIDLPACTLVDLRPMEHFCGIKLNKPGSYDEAWLRFQTLAQQDNWKQLTFMWNKVMLPLTTQVIPAIENVGVLDLERESKVHPFYEIEAQENGRLSCSGIFQWGFKADGIDENLGKRLIPNDRDDVFLYFDFLSLEPTVLQWLSEDEVLAEVLESGNAYERIFELVSQVKDHPKAKEVGKKIFLPTIYGSSAATLSAKLKWSERTTQTVINRLRETFAKAFCYVESFQEAAKSGIVRDRFGRKRQFSDAYYKALNFSVSSPATAICLERLVALHRLNVSPVLMSIHDGFVVSAPAKRILDVKVAVKECLESESSLAPGLKLKVACKGGRYYKDMQSL